MSWKFRNKSTNYANYLAIVIASVVGSLTIVLLFMIAKVYKLENSEIGLHDTAYIALYSTICACINYVISGFIPELPTHLESAPAFVLYFISLTTVLGATRYIPRFITSFKMRHIDKKGYRTIVIGAGAAAKIIVEDTRKNLNNKNKVVAFVDDDVEKIGKIYSGLNIEGPISNIQEIIKAYDAEEVIIAIATLSKERLHEILDLLSKTDVRVKRMPLFNEMAGPNDVRIVNVDLEELLGREPIHLDNSEMYSMLKGKTILVTGAGGSIGSELVRQIFDAHPGTLILFDIYENATYDIQMELVRKMKKGHINDIELVTLIGSTYNEIRVEQIIRKYRPDYIYHAAAYKHVPLMEDSPAEAIRTNVIGTYNVARLADKYKVKKMVLVSTDKAVRPTNVMGATKRFAETIIQYFDSKSETNYAAVRFGNVLGSNGSVVPLFKKQIEDGGPITLTDTNIIRYFMTIPEASSLILQCGLYAKGGEIFILDMGKPVRIYDLAVKLIKQAGLVPGKDIEIIETGLRPGEKLYEELLLDKKRQKKTAHERIFVEPTEPAKPIEEEIVEISNAFGLDKEVEDVKSMLRNIITTYHTENENH
ncbi:MAG: polysaccharide biosynthesis protein [Bacilli bacterium]|nr:polysaccharide biosynthesis protein [Bacilli bacterium]